MTYRPDPVDCASRTPVRGTRRGTANEWSTPRWDPNLPLLQLLDGGPLCARDAAPDKWTDTTPGAWKDQQYLTRACRECPVKAACLEFALTWDMVGVWGGTTTPERRRIRALRTVQARQDLADARAALG